MNFFTSDVHFNDEPTMINDNLPFKSIKAYDKKTIKTFNKQAGKNDTIFVIGDLLDCDNASCEGWKKAIHYVKKIKAKIVLIMGNNEERIVKYFFDGDFEKFRQLCLSLGYQDVCFNKTLTVEGQEFYLTHRPIDCKKDRMNLFGHTHRAGGLYRDYGFNVSFDVNHFKLYNEKDIKFLLYLRESNWADSKDLKVF